MAVSVRIFFISITCFMRHHKTAMFLVELISSIDKIGDVTKDKDRHYYKFLLTRFNSILQINL